MKNIILVSLLSVSLVACGGGGGGSVDNSAAIQQAMTNIVGSMGAANLPYAMTYVNGQQMGYVHGSTYGDIADAAAKEVVTNQAKWPDAYRALVSAAGMAILIKGSGNAADVHAVAKLGSDGKVGIVYG